MAFRRTGYCNLEVVSKLLSDKLHKICSIIKISSSRSFSSGKITPERKNVIHTFTQICLQLIPNTFFCIPDHCKMCYRYNPGFSDHPAYLSVGSHITATSSVGNRNIIRSEFAEVFNGLRKFCHTLICLRWEEFKGKELSFFHQFSQLNC